MASFGIAQNKFTYFHDLNEPGDVHTTATRRRPSTCRWACSATSTSKRRRTTFPAGTVLGTHTHQSGDKYAYDDGDGSTL